MLTTVFYWTLSLAAFGLARLSVARRGDPDRLPFAAALLTSCVAFHFFVYAGNDLIYVAADAVFIAVLLHMTVTRPRIWVRKMTLLFYLQMVEHLRFWSGGDISHEGRYNHALLLNVLFLGQLWIVAAPGVGILVRSFRDHLHDSSVYHRNARGLRRRLSQLQGRGQAR